MHWLLLRLRTALQSIELWDSVGYRPSNNEYMQHLLHYLYDEYVSNEMDLADFGAWSHHGWSSEDRSRDLPQQDNSYDCGVFAVLTIALRAHGVRVTSSSYTQLDVYRSSNRRRLAFLALSAGRQTNVPHAGGITPFVRLRHARPPAAPWPTKHFSRKQDRLIPSKVKVAKHTMKYHFCSRHQSRLLNAKRTYRSVAKSPTPVTIASKTTTVTPKLKAAQPPSGQRKRVYRLAPPPGTNHM